jgi:predicted nucleotidyltransferase
MTKTLGEMTLEELRAWKQTKADWDTIADMAHRIAIVAHPLKIVLIGSYARGDATEHSDVDLVVVQETDLPRPKRSIPLYDAVKDFLHPVDIVVYTPAEVEEYGDLPNSFIQTALREGKVLYEKE